MQPLPTPPSLQIQCDQVTDSRARELRQHPAARDVGFGWLRIAHQEYFPDRVFLVSTAAPVSVTFRHGAAGLEHMRASLTASIYACRNPQQLLDAEEAVEADEIESPSVS